jgi:hypothetical protein
MLFILKSEDCLILGTMVQAYNPITGEAEAGGSWFQGQPKIYNETLCQKKKKKAQVVEHLLSKCEALSSNPSATINNTK